MPMSLKCMIGKWLHKGQISQEEYDAVIKKLEGHDKQIRADGTREFAEWLQYGKHDFCVVDYDNRLETVPFEIILAEWQKGAENE